MYFPVYKSYVCYIFIYVCECVYNFFKLKKSINFRGIRAWQVLVGEKGRGSIRQFYFNKKCN